MSGAQFINKNIFDILENESNSSTHSSYLSRPVTPVYTQPETGVKRTNALAVLADKNTLEKCLARTKMCNSIEIGQNCPYKDRCRFAHDINELVITECLFGNDCRYVYRQNSKWFNKEGKKVCFHRHPTELNSEYHIRIGAKKDEISFKVETKISHQKTETKSITLFISNLEELKTKMAEAIQKGISEITINVL
jgi:hypothetical protein